MDENKKLDMDQLTAGELMPDVNQAAIDATVERVEAENREPQAEKVTLNKDGTPRKKRVKKTEEKQQNKSSVGGAEKPEVKPIEISSLRAGVFTSGLIERTSIALISDEWTLSELERAANVKAWTECYDHYGGVILSPPAALALDHLGIIMSRLPAPKTASKFELFKAWLNNKFAQRKFKNAHADSRKNSERKNDMGDKESARAPEKGN